MPGYFDDIFEGGSPNASRAYDAYVAGTDGPAWGRRPMNDVDYDITRMTDPSARFMGRIPLPPRRQPSIENEIAQWSRYGDRPSRNDMGMQQNRTFWDMLFGRNKPATRGGTPFGDSPNIDQEIARWAGYGGAAPAATGSPMPLSKPATKISSANDIASRISAMIGAPSTPPPVDFPDWSRVFGRADADFRNSLPVPPDPQRVDVPIPLREDSASRGGFGIPAGLAAIFGAQRRAYGGPIQMMRGGYPELYTQPIRQGHFSTGGGRNYVAPDGSGDGRSDHVDARLSPGEYVMDAESVSMLGNGDNDAGARKLDKMRQSIRKQKGKALAKGKFSPDAKKDAMEYLAHDGVSDGLRRRGRERE